MADDSLEGFRLFFMQDFLPVSLAMFNRARKGGANSVVEAFTEDGDPFDQLRQEGELDAKSVRENLDKLKPGLGNPVMSVKVDVESAGTISREIEDEDELTRVLNRIDSHLNQLEFEIGEELMKNSQNQENV